MNDSTDKNQVMLVTEPSIVKNTLEKQRKFFATGKTQDIEFRIQQLTKLKTAIKEREADIIKALYGDLKKPELEGYLELAVLQDITQTLKHIKRWMKPQKVGIPLIQFPASAYIKPEPLGVVLIIGPWNYPFSLIVSPLIGAIAAGNCVMVKPSEISPHTSDILCEIIKDTFSPEYIAAVPGGIETGQALLAQKFDHIFFTGGTKIGKIVMEAAAKNLTPITLELGGKSPCIVDDDINLKETAKRITWGKFLNAGQTCIAPDYLLVNRNVKSELINQMQNCLQEFYGDNPANSPDFARIVNQKQWDKLASLLTVGKIITGGSTNREDLYIAPTLITDISLDSPVMKEEIFGPILPILEYESLEEAIAIVNRFPKPLALYLFSRDKNKQEQVLNNTSSGGVCLNDTIMHVGLPQLPFGGVGESGIGNYHGKFSFDTFSHQKSILKKTFWFDFNWRYAPYKDKLGLFKKLTQ